VFQIRIRIGNADPDPEARIDQNEQINLMSSLSKCLLKNIEVKSWTRIRIETNADPIHWKGIVKNYLHVQYLCTNTMDLYLKMLLVKDFE
jgi:hypothetical protein